MYQIKNLRGNLKAACRIPVSVQLPILNIEEPKLGFQGWSPMLSSISVVFKFSKIKIILPLTRNGEKGGLSWAEDLAAKFMNNDLKIKSSYFSHAL